MHLFPDPSAACRPVSNWFLMIVVVKVQNNNFQTNLIINLFLFDLKVSNHFTGYWSACLWIIWSICMKGASQIKFDWMMFSLCCFWFWSDFMLKVYRSEDADKCQHVKCDREDLEKIFKNLFMIQMWSNGREKMLKWDIFYFQTSVFSGELMIKLYFSCFLIIYYLSL